MTTVIADARLGVIVSDSNATDDDRAWSERKVFRHKGALYGFAGTVDERIAFMEWIKGDGKAPDFSNSYCMMLSESGLFIYDKSTMPQKVARGIEAIGTGAKAAMCAYEAMGYADPKRAVAIVCKHDSGSRTPVRVYRLKG
jgi:hypothetical protein